MSEIEEMYNQHGIQGVPFHKWAERFNEVKTENEDNSFITQKQMIEMVNESFRDTKNLSQSEGTVQKISELMVGRDDATIEAYILNISEIRQFYSKKNRKLTLQKMLIEDDEKNQLWVNIWNKDIVEFTNQAPDVGAGSKVQLKNLKIQKGYRTEIEGTFGQNSKIKILNNDLFSEEPILDITEFNEINKEGTYRVSGEIIFKSKPEVVGLRELPLSKIILTDGETPYEINIWKEGIEDFDEIRTGARITVTIDASKYNDELNYTYNRDFPITQGKYNSKLKLATSSYEEINECEEYTKVNLEGRISRIFSPIPYDKGDITTYTLMLPDNNEIDITLFGKSAKLIEPRMGDYLSIYNGTVVQDMYSFQRKINYNWDTLLFYAPIDEAPEEIQNIEIKNKINSLNDVADIADEDIYADVLVLVLRKRTPIIYQKEDNSAGIVTRYIVADKTKITTMVVWGDQHNLLQQGCQYTINNVTITENFDTAEFEVTVNNRARITESSQIDKEILFQNFPETPEITEELLSEPISLTGTVNPGTFQLKVYQRCPKCGKRLTESMINYYCEQCQETVEKPYDLTHIITTINTPEPQDIEVWGESATDWITKQPGIPLEDQLDFIKENLTDKYKFYGSVDYDEKKDKIYLKVLTITVEE